MVQVKTPNKATHPSNPWPVIPHTGPQSNRFACGPTPAARTCRLPVGSCKQSCAVHHDTGYFSTQGFSFSTWPGYYPIARVMAGNRFIWSSWSKKAKLEIFRNVDKVEDFLKSADEIAESGIAIKELRRSAKKYGLKNADEIKDYGQFSSWKSSNPGKSGWNPKRNGSLDSTENAFQHYGKHKSDFPEYKSAQNYVEGANDFVSSPPTGTLTKTRAYDGTKVQYHEPTNRVSFSTDGKPDSYFKPADGRTYYEGL